VLPSVDSRLISEHRSAPLSVYERQITPMMQLFIVMHAVSGKSCVKLMVPDASTVDPKSQTEPPLQDNESTESETGELHVPSLLYAKPVPDAREIGARIPASMRRKHCALLFIVDRLFFVVTLRCGLLDGTSYFIC